MFSLDRFDDIWDHEIDRMDMKKFELDDFRPEDFCVNEHRGRLIYHNDYIEELKCQCGQVWQRENKKDKK